MSKASESSKEEVKKLLPHRDPFLFVDWVDVVDGKIIAERTFQNDEFFKGHFPEYPVVPGVVLVETLAQAGGAGMKKSGVMPADGLFFLAKVSNARFKKQVKPGDCLTIEVENLKASAAILHQSGKGYVNGELAVEAEWICMVGAR